MSESISHARFGNIGTFQFEPLASGKLLIQPAVFTTIGVLPVSVQPVVQPPHPAVEAAVRTLADANAVRRLFSRDAALWSADETVQRTIDQRLGWLDIAGGYGNWAALLEDLRRNVAARGLQRVVLAGMGGSSLAPEVFARVFPDCEDRMSLQVLDSTHPAAVDAALGGDLSKTLVIIASKSGSTEETACFAAHAAARIPSPTQLVAITDARSSLDEQAITQGWGAVLRNPADIGGRFSALSLFGMVPAALLGVDVQAIWSAAATMLTKCAQTAAPNPAVELAAFAAGLSLHGLDKLTIMIPPALAPLAVWIEQLVAESTGKAGRGVVPIVDEPVGSPAVYGDDRAFVLYRVAGETVADADALRVAGHPVFVIDVPDVLQLGAEFVRWQVATALMGVVLGVNPFDEPNVTEAKTQTRAILDGLAADETQPEREPDDAAALIASLQPGDYLSIQAYLPPDAQLEASLSHVRSALRDQGLSSTFGWGPRFLHSTGQLHKGGANNVVVLQLVDGALEQSEKPIPGKAYDFATLIQAQAEGDLLALRAHGRKVTQTPLDGPQSLAELIALSIRRHTTAIEGHI